jgi:thiol:disulfide interchange protein
MRKKLPSVMVAAMVLLGLTGSCTKRPIASGIPWRTDLKAAQASAVLKKKPVLVEFMAQWCPSCRAMEDSTFNRSEVIGRAGSFIPVRVDIDSQKTVAAEYGATARKYGGIGIPNFLFLDPAGRTVVHRVGYMNAATFSALMDSVLSGALAAPAAAH